MALKLTENGVLRSLQYYYITTVGCGPACILSSCEPLPGRKGSTCQTFKVFLIIVKYLLGHS